MEARIELESAGSSIEKKEIRQGIGWAGLYRTRTHMVYDYRWCSFRYCEAISRPEDTSKIQSKYLDKSCALSSLRHEIKGEVFAQT